MSTREHRMFKMRRVRGESLTREEAQRRGVICQRERQSLLRTAVTNSTYRRQQQEYGRCFSIAGMVEGWRQETADEGDFEAVARHVMEKSSRRDSRPRGSSRSRSSRSRRSASEPSHGPSASAQNAAAAAAAASSAAASAATAAAASTTAAASATVAAAAATTAATAANTAASAAAAATKTAATKTAAATNNNAAATAPPPGHMRRHSVSIPLVPAVISGPYFFFRQPVPQPIFYASAQPHAVNRAQKHMSGVQHTNAQPHPVSRAQMQMSGVQHARAHPHPANRAQMHMSGEQHASAQPHVVNRAQMHMSGVQHASAQPHVVNRAQMHMSGSQQTQHGYSGAHVAVMQKILVVPGYPYYNVGISADTHRPASFAGHASASRSQPADCMAQPERRHPTAHKDSARRASQENIAPAAASQSDHSPTRTLPGNFAQLEKSRSTTDGSPIKSPSRNLRL